MEGKQVSAAASSWCTAVYKAFTELDASLLEVNPSGRDQGSGDVIALDAKMSFDDNALVPARRSQRMRDETEEDPTELEASKHELELYQARWQHRLHGERCRPCDGDDGHHQALRRATREFPGCRRSCDEGTGDDGVQDHHVGPEREGYSGEYLRRHHALRRDRRRRRSRRAESRPKVPLVVRLEGTNVELGKQIIS